MDQTLDISYEEQLVESLKANVAVKRQDYLDGFLKLGFPHKKDEEYKFTYVRKFVEKTISPDEIIDDRNVSAETIMQHRIKEEGFHIVFVNGVFEQNRSDLVADETEVGTITDYSSIDKHTKMVTDPFVALNSAFSEGAVTIRIPRNHKSKPVFIYHFINNTGTTVAFPKIRIDAETGSEVNILEKTVELGEGSAFLNRVVEVDVARNASVNISKLQANGNNIYEIDGIFAFQHKDSRFYTNTFTFSGALVRNNLNVDLEEEHCETHMHGLYLLSGKSHVDNHTTVDHKFANSMSNELYKGIVDEKSTAVFNGKIYVRPDAQQTNAFQSNNNISLSDTATIHTKPQLEIWADDVSCSHGCTIGQLDEDAIYYMRARGIDKRSAKAMMLVAFAEESFEYIPFDFFKEELHALIEKKLIG